MVEHISLGKSFAFLENGTMTPKSTDIKLSWASQASQLLYQLGGEHTFQPPPKNLHYAMEIGHAIVATCLYDELAGFVKMTPWVVGAEEGDKPVKKGSMAENEDDFEKIHNGTTVPIGSLVVDSVQQGNNLGKALVNHMVTMSNTAYPTLQKIAVVTNDKTASLHVFNRLQWKIITSEEAVAQLGIDILDGWEPESTIFLYQGVKEDIS